MKIVLKIILFTAAVLGAFAEAGVILTLIFVGDLNGISTARPYYPGDFILFIGCVVAILGLMNVSFRLEGDFKWLGTKTGLTWIGASLMLFGLLLVLVFSKWS